MLIIEPYWGMFLVAVVLPAAVALVTKRVASPAVKALTLVLLSAVTGVVSAIVVDGAQLSLSVALTNVFVTFVTGVAVHYGLLKPTGVTGSDGAIARGVQGGIG